MNDEPEPMTRAELQARAYDQYSTAMKLGWNAVAEIFLVLSMKWHLVDYALPPARMDAKG